MRKVCSSDCFGIVNKDIPNHNDFLIIKMKKYEKDNLFPNNDSCTCSDEHGLRKRRPRCY